LPKDVTLHVARLPSRRSPPIHRNTATHIEVQSRALATADVDVIVLGAAAPVILKGRGYDLRMGARNRSSIGQARDRHSPRSSKRSIFGISRVGGRAYDDKVTRSRNRF